ncbi:MAG: rRNA maturation RNase YbeY [Phycisphaeraceae bacterium]|jgi:probable rRNA maturation factor|nr:rRNA maturation RNase YbeY [Phycisphaeraceae bacterium]MDP7348578.1 rRNA maturation RNase YbeY [Phycisphaeraceae bacterium]
MTTHTSTAAACCSDLNAENSDDDGSGGSSDQPPPTEALAIAVHWDADVARAQSVDVAGAAPGMTTTKIEHWLERHLVLIAEAAGVRGGQLRVSVIDDAQMRDLHKRHKRIDDTTDVLTFDLRDEDDEPVDADVAICIDQAQQAAAHHGHDVHHELLLYAVHGLMHLMGHNDNDPDAAHAMHAAEDDLLTQIGIGAVYATPTVSTPTFNL